MNSYAILYTSFRPTYLRPRRVSLISVTLTLSATVSSENALFPHWGRSTKESFSDSTVTSPIRGNYRNRISHTAGISINIRKFTSLAFDIWVGSAAHSLFYCFFFKEKCSFFEDLLWLVFNWVVLRVVISERSRADCPLYHWSRLTWDRMQKL